MASERTILAVVRGQCVDRDGYCRIAQNLIAGFGPCWGPSELAHLEQYRRFKTRGLPPEERHMTKGCAMLCRGHHTAYDAHRIQIELLTELGADGPLAFVQDGRRFVEELKRWRCSGM